MQCLCTYYAFFNPYSSIQSSETNTGPLCGEYLCISHVDTSERRHVGTSTRRHNLHFFPQLTDLPPYLFLHFTMNRIWCFCISRCVAPMGLFFCVACLLVGVSPPWGWECISHVDTSTPSTFAHSHTPSAVRRTTLAHLQSTSTRRHVDTSAHSAFAPEHNLKISSLHLRL